MGDTTASCGLPSKDDPQGNFEGDVRVTDDLPTQKDLEKCAEIPLLDAKANTRPFKDLYSKDATAQRHLIIFVRHFFCGICQEYLRALSASITSEELQASPKPASITVIGCGQPELIEMYATTTECTFPIFADPTRKLYDNLGMMRTLDMGSKKPDYMQSGIIGNAIRSIFQGMRAGRDALKSGDLKQIGGEFLFENGEVVWCHRMRNTRDHAEVAEIRKVLGLDASKPAMRKRWSTGIKGLARRSSSWSRQAKDEKNARSSMDRPRKSLDKLSVDEKEKKAGSSLKHSSGPDDQETADSKVNTNGVAMEPKEDSKEKLDSIPNGASTASKPVESHGDVKDVVEAQPAKA